MTVLVSDVVDRVRETLLDSASSYWSDDELIGWMNQCFADSVNRRSDFFSQAINITLSAGVEQNLPDGASQLLKVIRNISSGRGVLLGDIDALTHARPNWAAEPAVADVKRYYVDSNTPRRFYVYPPSNGTGVIEALVVQVPTPVIALTNTFPVASQYQGAVWAYMVACAYTKETDRGDIAKSNGYFALWNSALTTGQQVTMAATPQLVMAKR